jgi:ATP-dependent Lon protease
MSDSIVPSAVLEELPILALRNSVLFPAAVVPVNVGRPRSVRLIEDTFGTDRPAVGVVAQRDPEIEDPDVSDLYEVGTIARIVKVIRLGSGTYSVVLQGISRMRVLEARRREPSLRARVERIAERATRNDLVESLAARTRESARELLRTLPQPPRDLATVIDNVRNPAALADLVAAQVAFETARKQAVLEAIDPSERLSLVLEQLRRQLEIHRVKNEVASMVKEEMSRSQRELLLRQQLRSIRKELGESGDEDDVLEELRDRLTRAQPSPEAAKAAKRELSRMATMNAASAEYQVAFSYVEWLADLPWSRSTPDRLDVPEVRRVLDEDHHGLEAPKKRIVEYIAVRKLRRDKRSPILCFLGPPGVGKTSLGRSIARATGREFVRISLGGVHDEAEVRGHRRTYVGALPGRLVAGLKKAGARNPVFVLDEVDKLGVDFTGDPASALLEALDPEQNRAFSDHYLDVPVDLSQVLFVATANRGDTIPAPLFDRMEVIEIPGYTRDDKLAIARDFLVPRQLADHGLSPEQLDIGQAAIARMIDEYTHEAGVRQLAQQVAAVCRAVAVRVANGQADPIDAGPAFVSQMLGAPRREPTRVERRMVPGVATTLAWSPAGGELLFVESTRMPGKGEIHLTGHGGVTLKEAASAALTYIRAHAAKYGLPENFLDKSDLHVHLPKSATPQDSPSMGLPIFVSLISILCGVKVRPEVAVVGEITLRGKLLRVEGLRQKCLAAHHAGIKRVVLPRQNEPDLDEVPPAVRDAIGVHLVGRMHDALAVALASPLHAKSPRRTLAASV